MTVSILDSSNESKILLEFYLKNIRPMLSELEYGNLADDQVPILIGTIQILLNSKNNDWQNEGKKIIEEYPELKKYFD